MDIFAKYEPNKNSFSVELVLKIVKGFDLQVDYLPRKGKHATYDKKTVNDLKKIETLDKETRIFLFDMIYMRKFKARKAYLK